MATDPSVFIPRMRPNQPDRLNTRRTVLISFSLLSAYTAWSFFNAKVPILLAEVIDSKALIGFIMTLDNILAIVLQPLFGNWSDRTQSRLGRRMPFIIIGGLLSAIFLLLLPWAFLLLWEFILTICLFDICMNFWRSPPLSLLADYTPEKFRAKANAVGQFMGSIGPVFGFLITPIVNILFPIGDLNRIAGFFIVSIFMLLFLVAQFSGIKETPTGTRLLKVGPNAFEMDAVSFRVTPVTTSEQGSPPMKVRLWDDLKGVAQNKEKSALWLFLAVLGWYFAFSGIEAFATQFGTEYLFLPQITAGSMTFQQAESQTNLVFLAFFASTIVSALIAGKLNHKFGRKKLILVGLIGLASIFFLLAAVVVPRRDAFLFTIGMIGIGFFWILVIVTSIPMIWTLAPQTRVGTYTGLYYAFTQLAGVGSPFLLGALLDLATSSLGANRYLLLFPYMLACIIFALVCISRVRRGETRSPPS